VLKHRANGPLWLKQETDDEIQRIGDFGTTTVSSLKLPRQLWKAVLMDPLDSDAWRLLIENTDDEA
jgi:hypothetical protein